MYVLPIADFSLSISPIVLMLKLQNEVSYSALFVDK